MEKSSRQELKNVNGDMDYNGFAGCLRLSETIKGHTVRVRAFGVYGASLLTDITI